MADSRSVDVHLESHGKPWTHARVHALRGREAISELYAFDVEVACDPGHDLPEDALPGADVTLVVSIDGEEVRRIHGILSTLHDRLDEGDQTRAHHRLRVVPHAFRLSLVETQEIFLDQSIPDILRSKFERQHFGADELELRLIGTYPARELVVQYEESDLAFVRRLAEHAGISFFFEQGREHEKLVFTDHQDGFRPVEGAPEVAYRPRGEKIDVFALDLTSELVPTSYIVQDYNYRAPQVDLSSSHDLDTGNGGGVVEYGAHVKTPEESERTARIRAEERRCRQRVYRGQSTVAPLCAGGKAALTGHPRLSATEPLLVIEVEHDVKIPLFTGEGGDADKASYTNAFRAIPASIPFRPRRVTPRPRIGGVVTGVIQAGPGGETGGAARLDAEGRYTVQFHFDTSDPGEQKASHPMRMAQPFAGASYGMHMPLRPGTEVVVAFTNGDPDRPVIVGALYNTTSPSPVVASNATRHQIKSSAGVIFEIGSKT